MKVVKIVAHALEAEVVCVETGYHFDFNSSLHTFTFQGTTKASVWQGGAEDVSEPLIQLVVSAVESVVIYDVPDGFVATFADHPVD